MVGIDKHNISLFFNFRLIVKKILFLCLFNFFLYKINKLQMKFMNEIDKI